MDKRKKGRGKRKEKKEERGRGKKGRKLKRSLRVEEKRMRRKWEMVKGVCGEMQ